MNKRERQDQDRGAPQGADVRVLLSQVSALRAAMLAAETTNPWLRDVGREHRDSARNLVHFLALRGVDLRALQQGLAAIGLSSLGRAEAHVLDSVERVLAVLGALAGQRPLPLAAEHPAEPGRLASPLERNANALFGAAPARRAVRIMVTLPTEAATDAALVDALVAGGMDIARINCAHDSAGQWTAMAGHVRAAGRRANRPVSVLMDLAGPKLRTGAIDPAQSVLKLKPQRDEFGVMLAPASLVLRAEDAPATVQGTSPQLSVDRPWLERLEPGDKVDVVDARGAARRLTVAQRHDGSAVLECRHTVYLGAQSRLRSLRRDARPRDTALGGFPAAAGRLTLMRGDRLLLAPGGLGHDARPATADQPAQPATIGCTLPEALDALRKGERVLFDDGRIGGVVRRRTSKGVEIEITQARACGERLGADKGINLPDTHIELPALSAKDVADLAVAARYADIVGLSFAQSAGDVRQLQVRLRELGAEHLGLILKVETRRGFEQLPEMLFAAMQSRSAGVMIARGDLAVECGYERLAEVQEEMLWACEAAHMPVVWATQVLESMAKTGLPSRAEITDAAMGERAECVMLNKGPHILDAMRTLDDILRRMASHQAKKRPLLRALLAWRPAQAGTRSRADAESAASELAA